MRMRRLPAIFVAAASALGTDSAEKDAMNRLSAAADRPAAAGAPLRERERGARAWFMRCPPIGGVQGPGIGKCRPISRLLNMTIRFRLKPLCGQVNGGMEVFATLEDF
jgi:hypothetical protein